jgi:hypothetical protein
LTTKPRAYRRDSCCTCECEQLSIQWAGEIEAVIAVRADAAMVGSLMVRHVLALIVPSLCACTGSVDGFDGGSGGGATGAWLEDLARVGCQ